MKSPVDLRFLVGALIALSLGSILALNADEEDLQTLRTMAGLALALWAFAMALIGTGVAIRIKSLFRPIVLGVALGVLPVFIHAAFHLLPLPSVQEHVVIVLESVSGPILLPVEFLMQSTSLFFGIYSSHVSPRYMIFSWLGVTAASGAFWGLAVGTAAAIYLRIRIMVGSNEGAR